MSETTEYQYDVFISYSHLDRAWVEDQLLPRLEKANLKVCIDYRDFKYGLASQINMEEAAKDSRHTIAVLTQNWVNSEWSQFETLITTLRDPIGRLQRLIPLLREDCSLPERIEFRTYADFREVNEQIWERLLDQLLPQSSSSNSNSSTSPTSAFPDRNPFLGESPRLVGRDEEMCRIKEKLQAGNHCSLVGPPGSGKSHLLRAIHEDLPSWLGCQAQAVLALQFRGIYNLRELQETIVQALGGQKAGEWRSLFRSKSPRLIVLDDVGVMDSGERGLAMRSWLRGLDDGFRTKLLLVSNERLEVLFRKDDPTRDSPLAGLDPTPVQCRPLPITICRQLVAQRLERLPLDVEQFADLFSQSRQPRDLLNLCAQRFEDLRKSDA